jgi:hypothetical protein
MSTKKNLQFHIANHWKILFTAHNADGSVLPLDAGVEVNFRLNSGSTILFTKSIGSGIVVTDAANGKATITISPGDQTANGIVKNKSYLYEIQLITPEPVVSTQADGALKVLPSLFAP